jgi:hypothetical protein
MESSRGRPYAGYMPLQLDAVDLVGSDERMGWFYVRIQRIASLEGERNSDGETSIAIGLRELARRLNCPHSTLHRYLEKMHRRKLIRALRRGPHEILITIRDFEGFSRPQYPTEPTLDQKWTKNDPPQKDKNHIEDQLLNAANINLSEPILVQKWTSKIEIESSILKNSLIIKTYLEGVSATEKRTALRLFTNMIADGWTRDQIEIAFADVQKNGMRPSGKRPENPVFYLISKISNILNDLSAEKQIESEKRADRMKRKKAALALLHSRYPEPDEQQRVIDDLINADLQYFRKFPNNQERQLAALDIWYQRARPTAKSGAS